MIFAAIFTVAAVVYAVTIYSFGTFLDDNLAYMALYYDGVSVDLYRANASQDAIILASSTASTFCELYSAERRTVAFTKYKPLCDAINDRTSLFIACADIMSPGCSPEVIANVSRNIDAAAPLAKELLEKRPYFSLVFNDDFFVYREKPEGGFFLR
jgi:hypothetical protein